MENAGMRLFASVILGIVIALFVGVGINTFYPEPTYPMDSMAYVGEPTEEEIEASNEAYEAYETQRQAHSSVVGIVAIIFSVALMLASLVLTKKNTVISQGLLLGGLLLICYGAIQGISSGNTLAAFLSIGVGLAALIILILRRFTPTNSPAGTE
jgi:hypothetical protein